MKYIYLLLAALLLLCLAPMPYGYYQLIRFISMTVFLLIAYRYYEKRIIPYAISFVMLSLLFKPFLKIALGRVIWNFVDVITAILLVYLYHIERKKE